MNKYSKFLIIAAVALGACNSNSETNTTATDSTAAAGADTTRPAEGSGTAGSISPTKLADQSSPEGVAYIIFEAAKSGDYSKLTGICGAQADGDSKSICDLVSSDEKKQNEFKEWFAKGTVSGVPQVEGTMPRFPLLSVLTERRKRN